VTARNVCTECTAVRSKNVNFCTYFGDQFITQTFAFLVECHCDFYCFVVKHNLPLVRGGSQCGNIGPCPPAATMATPLPPPPAPECKPQNSRCVVVQFMFCCTVGWIDWLIDWMNWLKIRRSYQLRPVYMCCTLRIIWHVQGPNFRKAYHHHHHHPRMSSRRKSWNKTSGPLWQT